MTRFVHRDVLRTAWYPVAQTGDVNDAPLAVRLLGDDLVVWRGLNGALAVAPDRCPHREAPLSIGTGAARTSAHGERWTSPSRQTLRP